MLSGRGERLLFADADGASKFSDIAKLDSAMNEISDKQVRCYKVNEDNAINSNILIEINFNIKFCFLLETVTSRP